MLVKTALLLALVLAAGSGAAANPLTKPTERIGGCGRAVTKKVTDADAPGAKGFGIVFYGDSIIESLQGTDVCASCDKTQRRSTCKGVAAWFDATYGKWNPGVLGMAGDETAHLLYRLLHGQIPKVHKPKVAVLLIGDNDLTNSGWSLTQRAAKEAALARTSRGIIARIEEAADLLRQGMPGTKVVLLGLLPRGTGTGKGLLSADNDFSWPSHYAKAIANINKNLSGYAAKSKKAVTFLDCGKAFVSGNRINAALMADALHPTLAGWKALSACMQPTLKKLMA